LPLFYQHNINQTTKLGIWHITEAEDFFLQQVPLQRSITHPHKRLQHLAGRWLLKFLFPDFPNNEILIADTRKPYLPYEQYHFSVSHCGEYAAAIVSSDHRCGIDIENVSDKIERVSHKFIHASEKSWLRQFASEKQLSALQLYTTLWSAKESVFKWYSLGGIDFKENMQLSNYITSNNYQLLLPFFFQKDIEASLQIHARFFDDLVLSWVITKA
jgi:phosphopantetheinyl transferase